MNKRILIVGAGQNQVGVIRKAMEMGLHAVAMDGNPNAPGLKEADEGVVANITDSVEVLRTAKQHGVQGMYCAAEPAVEPFAQAAAQLGLPGPAPEVAHCVRNKLAMREALESKGVPNPCFRAAYTVEQAEAAAQEIGLPAIVKPTDGNASKGVRRIDRVEDLAGAFFDALAYARNKCVLLEQFMEGTEVNIDGLVHEGNFILGGMTGKDRCPPPRRFDLGIYMPPLLDDATIQDIVEMTSRALAAIGFLCGTAHIEVILTESGPRIVEIAGRLGGGRIPTDLIPLTYGMDFMADSINLVFGDSPKERWKFERGTAVYWLPAQEGEVTEIQGFDEARAIPGVEDLVVNVKPGDRVEPIVDCVTRDRIGYVFTSGATVREAITTARHVQEICRVITRPIGEKP